MGCSGSKGAVVPSVGSSQAWTTEKKPASAGSTKSGRTKLIRVSSAGKGTAVEEMKPSVDSNESRASLRSGNNRGVSSATSKASAHTYDSGLEADYGNIITEESDPTLQQEAIQANRPNTPDLTISGNKIASRKRSGKSRTDEDIIHELKSQGLLSRPVAAQSGISFDVMIAPDFGLLKKPPPRLAKLKKRKTKKKVLTREELEAKLKSAEERRRRKEAEKLEKLNTAAKEKQAHGIVDASEEAQKKEIVVKNAEIMGKVNENKEARLQAIKEKQEKRRAHAEKVRLARLARLAEGAPTQDSNPNPEEDDTPVVST